MSTIFFRPPVKTLCKIDGITLDGVKVSIYHRVLKKQRTRHF